MNLLKSLAQGLLNSQMLGIKSTLKSALRAALYGAENKLPPAALPFVDKISESYIDAVNAAIDAWSIKL